MAKIPETHMGAVDEIPRIPSNGWAEDYRDDWINLVARRLTRQMSDLSAPQRRVLASVAYDRKYRKALSECEKCGGSGCETCHDRGEIATPTIRYIGRDARTRPVCERLEHGKWRRWAIGREGQPVDPSDPVTEEKFIWKRAS
jgi:hypothetical protein